MIRDFPTPPRIEREALYDDSSARAQLGVPGTALARARREGRLRYVRHGTRIVYLGEWLLDWLRATGEPGPPSPDSPAPQEDDGAAPGPAVHPTARLVLWTKEDHVS